MRDDLIGTMGTRLDDDELLAIYEPSTGHRYGIVAVTTTDRAGGRILLRRQDQSPVIVLEEYAPGRWIHVVLDRDDECAAIARALEVYSPGTPDWRLGKGIVGYGPDWPEPEDAGQR